MPGAPATPATASPDPVDAAPVQASRWVLGSRRLPGWRAIAVAGLLVAIGAAAGTILARSGEPVREHDATAASPPVAITAPPSQAAPPVDAPLPVPLTPPPPAVHEDIVQPPRHEPSHPAKPRPAQEPAAIVPAPAVEPPPVADPPKPAPAPVREAPRAADPWQRMKEALARCGAEDLFGRIGCEYRVRTTFCEGHWGENAQCPGAPVNDHGQ